MNSGITIGVAGHVDHGKTTLVRTLTGIDTDRRPDEKVRGMSIDAGVAPLFLPSGKQAAMVDVPGHVDFLKNAIRGLNHIDLGILVVAADDGVMPQTREHLEILRFFGVKAGFVVLSKADLVDEETLALAELEVRELLKESFLENSPIIPFSAMDHRGSDMVQSELEKRIEASKERDLHAPFRLWIDQINSFPGFGTVVSGTAISGKLAINDPVEILPKGMKTRARSLESHHQKFNMITAGQRAGINLHKVSQNDVNRGMTLAEPGFFASVSLLNVHIKGSGSAKSSIKNRQRVKLYLGTSVTNALVILMDQESLDPGEEGLAQLRLNKPVAALPKDNFVISLLNMPSIIGGGRVLEVSDEKYRSAKSSRILPRLKALQTGELKTVMDHLIGMEHNDLITAEALVRRAGLPLAEIQTELDVRVKNGELLSFGARGVFPKVRFQALKHQVPKIVADILSGNTLKLSATPEEIKKNLSPALDDMCFLRILSEICNERKLLKLDGGFRIPQLFATLSKNREKLIAMLLDYAETSGFVPFSADTFWKLHRKQYNKNEIQRLLNYLHVQGRLIQLNNGRFMSPRAMAQIKKRVKEVIRRNGVFTIPDCKETMGYGRTVGIPVLEYLDSIGFTRREGDTRRLR